ncbi:MULTISPECIES: leucine-rich repeat domain-containing protein [Clostridium]|uniref:Ig-like domain-containing protein n=1 Tax=Clostridium frigoriphilum TaxID=443253 RepID=A0ABU7UX08_9CLOT|nr:Ig-like domain-containing protein [Clostridium sp. DSM 17811]MBU3101771.1 Ig-like domain-containing protein [Clostridium sp. DSM 17811]
MINKKLYMGLSKFVVAVMLASSVSGVAHASTGDIINITNKKVYNVTSSKDVQALISDLKDGGTDVFLKEGSDGKYYSPSDKLNLQSAEIARLLKAANVDIKNPTAIKTYIKNNAATIVAAIKVETDKAAKQTVDTSSYITPTVANLTVNSVSDINDTATVGDTYILPTTVIVTLSDGTTKSLAVTWDKIASTTVSGAFTFIGTLTMVDGVGNTNNVTVQATLTVVSAISDDTDITSKFTDAKFKAKVYDYICKKNTDKIIYSDLKNITDINLGYRDISSLSGIEYFTSLTTLDCNGNKLKTLDVSKNLALIDLNCSKNQLKNLDISKNIALTNLDCHNNQLTNLDVSKNTALTELDCYNNQLTNLDVNKNTELTNLDCHNNGLTNLDVSKNIELDSLVCGYNKLTILDVSKNIALISLECHSNQLTTLDVSKNTALTELGCQANQLIDLDVSKSIALDSLDCGGNQLANLDVSKNMGLTSLLCSSNRLTKLDLSNNIQITSLFCGANQLTALDLSENIELTDLDCSMNQLTNLDLSKNIALTSLQCFFNQLTVLYSIKDTWFHTDYEDQYTDSTQTTTDILVITIKY